MEYTYSTDNTSHINHSKSTIKTSHWGQREIVSTPASRRRRRNEYWSERQDFACRPSGFIFRSQHQSRQMDAINGDHDDAVREENGSSLKRVFYCTGGSKHNYQQVEDVINDAKTICGLNYGASVSDPSALARLDWHQLGKELSQCKNLEGINIHRFPHELTPEILTALFQADGPYEFPLETMSVTQNSIGPMGVAALAPFLKARKECETLNLSHNDLGYEGARMVAEILDHVCISTLILNSSRLTLEGIRSVLSSKNSVHLFALSLDVERFGRDEVEYIAQFLCRKDLTLNVLTLGTESDVDDIDIEWIEIFLRSLRYNTSLSLVSFRGSLCINGRRQYTYDRFDNAMKALVCNPANFEALCHSNHVVKSFEFEKEDIVFSESVQFALHVNQTSRTDNQKVRVKLRRFYFYQHAFDLQPFLGMKLVFMPNVMELVTKIEESVESPYFPWIGISLRRKNLNGVYRFIRHWNVGNLFVFRGGDVLIKQKGRLPSESDGRDQKIRDLENEVVSMRRDIEQLKDAVCRLEEENKRLLSVVYSDNI